MKTNKSRKVKEEYTTYQILLEGRKTFFTEKIYLQNKKKTHANFLSKTEQFNHTSFPNDDNMRFEVEVEVNNYNNFKFKLRYNNFIEQPFFRFDSNGPYHKNRVNGKIVEQITTPHFHKFNENGVEIAYKTEKLLDPNESEYLKDISLCIIHFFHEANMRLNKDDFPEIIISPELLPFKLTEDDPNANVNFP